MLKSLNTLVRDRMQKGGPGSGRWQRGEGKAGYPKQEEEKDPKTAKEFARRMIAHYKTKEDYSKKTDKQLFDIAANYASSSRQYADSPHIIRRDNAALRAINAELSRRKAI